MPNNYFGKASDFSDRAFFQHAFLSHFTWFQRTEHFVGFRWVSFTHPSLLPAPPPTSIIQTAHGKNRANVFYAAY